MKKTLLFTKKNKSVIALLLFSLVFNYSWGQIDLSSYDLINTGDANDPVSIHSFSKEEVNGTTKNNAAANTLDKNNATVWAADDGDVLSGDYKGDGEYIIYDLGESQDVRLIQFSTTSKSDPFGYQVWISTTGTDASDFTKILPVSDDILLTKTSTTDFNQYEIQNGVNARYVKVIGYGRYNGAGDTRTSVWNAIGEIEFYEPGSGSGSNTGSGPTNLVKNGTADDFIVEADGNGLLKNTNDNADAWDMTPPSKVIGNDGIEVDSPYTWSNTDLQDWLASECGDADEQPGSSGDGNFVNGVKTRGVKINEACRRLYQEIAVTAGKEYTFSIESRSEAENVPSEVFILNTAIASEVDLSSTSTTVDAYMNITNDFNKDKSNATTNNFTTTTFNFTASTSKVIIYVRAPLAVDGDNEVFYDNISLMATSTPEPPTGNLVLNPTGDEWTASTGDNADAFDMTPNSKIKDNATNQDVDSPYRALWNNTALEDYLETTYNGGSGVDEQPGSSTSGTYDESDNKTRSIKLYDDGNPSITGSSRRIYQKINVVAGTEYTFSVDSRSEAENIFSDIYMLNEEITTEVGLENGAADPRVDAYLQVTNDFNASSGSASNNTFTNNSFSFTASTSTVVIYIRSLSSDSEENEVFFDNFSLMASTTASVDDVFASKVSIYPNPATQFVNISSELEINRVDVYNVLGKRVISAKKLSNNSLDVSELSTGVYLMKLASGKSIISKKLIIK